MAVIRAVNESPLTQGDSESIIYAVTTTPWGSSPTAVAVTVEDLSNAGTDVTVTVMPAGSPSVVGDVITLPPLTALTAGHRYRVEIKFTAVGNTFECYLIVIAEG